MVKISIMKHFNIYEIDRRRNERENTCLIHDNVGCDHATAATRIRRSDSWCRES